MLVLKPVGPGNWAKLTMQLEGSRAQPMLVKVGDRVPLFGITYRIVEVRP